MVGLHTGGWNITDWQLLLQICMGIALVVVGLLTIRTRAHRSLDKDREKTIELQGHELEVWRERAARLESELQAARTDISKLQGIVEQQREEIASLRDMLMGKSVQPALFDAMQTVARGSLQSMQEALDESLRPIAQGLDRLLTAKDAEKEEGQ